METKTASPKVAAAPADIETSVITALQALFLRTAAPASAAAVSRIIGVPVGDVIAVLSAARSKHLVHSDRVDAPSVWWPAASL